MGYVVRFSMKPKKGMFKRKYGTLVMDSRRKYKTKADALKEATKMKKEHRSPRFRRYSIKVKVLKRR